MSNERWLKNLKTRQKSLLASFFNIKAFVEAYDEVQHECQVAGRLEHLVTLWNDFNAVQAELETLDEAEVDNHLKQRIEFESSFFEVKGFLLSKNKSSPSPPTPSSSHSTPHAPAWSSHVRLPDVKLPVFNGNIDSWLNFHDLFVSLVYCSHELSNIQKFYYLRSSLSGEALKLIQTISISANNYLVAWTLLVDHYQKPARLKQTYVDSLFEFPSLKRESATELRNLVERFEANVKVLKQLGEKTEFWDILLIRMLSIRLDPTTRRDWEEYSSTLPSISFPDLTGFIQRRASVLETIGKNVEQMPSNVINKKPLQRAVTSHGANQPSFRKCISCSKHHPLYLCPVFSKLSLEEKEKEVRQHQLCRNCLRKGHHVKDCSSTSTCRYCRGRHHSQICTNGTSGDCNPIKPRQPSKPTNEQPSVSLPAALKDTPCLAAAKLPLIAIHRQKLNCPIVGIGQSITQARFKVRSTIRSRVCQYSATLEFLVLPKITIDLPSTSVNTSSWSIPSGIELADPSFYKSSRIDLILGAEIFFDLIKTSERIPLGDGLPTLVNSVLGWIVTGKNEEPRTSIRPVVANLASTSDLNQLMERFWSLENDNSSPNYSVEEAACENHFLQHVSRTPEGRYCVRLPTKRDILDKLTDNRRTALRRFHMLESKLNRNQNLKQQYDSFMDEYESLGHMQKVLDPDQPPTPCYHLPHHAVVREESTTTKVRVVFDASCKTPNGPSLNSALMIGPIVQEDLRSIIMRSRLRPVMVIADIKQMYRQILVHEDDTPLQRIVWRASPDAPMWTYELKTVTYGTASAPYLATRVLQQLADDECDQFPEAARVLKRDFYVDDLFSGADSVDEAVYLRKQLHALLIKGGFELRKWASNMPAVLEDVTPDNRALQASVDLWKHKKGERHFVQWKRKDKKKSEVTGVFSWLDFHRTRNSGSVVPETGTRDQIRNSGVNQFARYSTYCWDGTGFSEIPNNRATVAAGCSAVCKSKARGIEARAYRVAIQLARKTAASEHRLRGASNGNKKRFPISAASRLGRGRISCAQKPLQRGFSGLVSFPSTSHWWYRRGRHAVDNIRPVQNGGDKKEFVYSGSQFVARGRIFESFSNAKEKEVRYSDTRVVCFEATTIHRRFASHDDDAVQAPQRQAALIILR
ncbi:uncharacterized protein LOC129737791 [Uranotaenia lowii]|uniref:uncharacterized protein LOC129737791 n=1 Tax=Uranotaenia lowii TaxID=190385 RepID=UPI00247945BA|nr:uncharacterized protein LOC129737791 [Uranotaenia lowii]